jgi:hypothetical protein
MERAKRAFETPETAPYKRQVLPRLNAELGVPADPRRLAPPTDPSLPSGAPTPMPTTSASNKKSNVQIPYTRVTRDAEALGAVGTPLFVRAHVRDPLITSMPDEKIDAVAGMDAVNAELSTQLEDENAWRIDGVLLSTESEMDPVLQNMGVRNTTTTTAILEAVQGPTQMRNMYSSRPLVGDYVYLGLVWGGAGSPGYAWKPFSSQHLDMEFVPEQPRAQQLGFAGHAKRKLLHVEFSKDDRQRLCRAVCLGRVIDSAPSPGMLTVNVAIREMSIDELGRRHDEEHVVYTSEVGAEVRWPHGRVETTRWDYVGPIGRRCPARVVKCLPALEAGDPPDDDDVLRVADQLVRLPETPSGVDPSIRLGAVARALADDDYASRLEAVCAIVASFVPLLIPFASEPTRTLDTDMRTAMQRAAFDLEIFFTLAEGAAPPLAPGSPVRLLALQRTRSTIGRRDTDVVVWLLQRAAIVAGALDAVLVSSIFIS